MLRVLNGCQTGVTYLYVFDADSGEFLGTPAVEPNFSIGDPVIGPDGTVYLDRETGDTSHIEAIAWGTTEPFAPFGIGDESNSPAISRDGSRVAYVSHGDLDLLNVSWATDAELLAVAWCCFPEYEESPRAYAGPVGGLESIFGTEQFDEIDAGSSSEVALVADGGLTIFGTDTQRRDFIGTGSGVVAAELF